MVAETIRNDLNSLPLDSPVRVSLRGHSERGVYAGFNGSSFEVLALGHRREIRSIRFKEHTFKEDRIYLSPKGSWIIEYSEGRKGYNTRKNILERATLW